jgi:transposase
MQVLYPHSAGLDVHKKTVVAAYVRDYDAQGNEVYDTKTFDTMTRDLLALADWLQERGILQVAMESTGEYWKPVYNLLEDQFTLLVVNAHHVKHVPGRKTDVNDAQWLAKLLTHGLLTASFIPPAGQRELREMTRARAAMVKERTNLFNRVHKTLESANIKLASVVTDIGGVSARAMLAALLEGHTNPAEMADLARGRLRSKRADLERALEGRFKATQQFIVNELLCQIDGLDESIARFDAEIEKLCVPFERAVAHADTIPGIGKTAAQAILGEIGTDMSAFPSVGHIRPDEVPSPHPDVRRFARQVCADFWCLHISAWAGVAPGNHQSGGKTLSSRTHQGNRHLKRVLIEAAHAAVKVKDTYLWALYHRLVGRRGKRRAIVAVAHAILGIIYHLIKRDEDYKELGSNYFDTRQPTKTAQNLVSRLQQLGYDVELNPRTEAVAA